MIYKTWKLLAINFSAWVTKIKFNLSLIWEFNGSYWKQSWLKEVSGWDVRELAYSSGGRWFESSNSITKIWWFEHPLRLTVQFHSLVWIKKKDTCHTLIYLIISNIWKCHLMSGCGDHTKTFLHILSLYIIPNMHDNTIVYTTTY